MLRQRTSETLNWSDEGLTLETSAFQIRYGGSFTFINFQLKIKLVLINWLNVNTVSRVK